MGKGSLRAHRAGPVKKRRFSSGAQPRDISKAYRRNKKHKQKEMPTWK